MLCFFPNHITYFRYVLYIKTYLQHLSTTKYKYNKIMKTINKFVIINYIHETLD